MLYTWASSRIPKECDPSRIFLMAGLVVVVLKLTLLRGCGVCLPNGYSPEGNSGVLL